MKQVFTYRHQKSIIVTEAQQFSLPDAVHYRDIREAIIRKGHHLNFALRHMIFQVYIFDHANEHEARNALVSFVAEYLDRYDVHVTDGTYFKTDLRPYLGQIA
jgi:hypothetical protein